MLLRLLTTLCLLYGLALAQAQPGLVILPVTPKSASVSLPGAAKTKVEFPEGRDVAVHHYRAAYGSYTATVSAPGYAPLEVPFTLSPADRTFEPEVIALSPLPTTGTLAVSVAPQTASVTLLGPNGYSLSFVGDRVIPDLAPGTYSLAASASGYQAASASASVTTGQTASVSLTLAPDPPPATGLGPNLLKNGGFEDAVGTDFDFWLGTAGKPEVRLETANPKGGAKAVRVESSALADGNYFAQQLSGVTGGKTYRLSAWVRTENFEPGYRPNAYFNFANVRLVTTEGVYNLVDGYIQATVAGWTLFTRDVALPAGATASRVDVHYNVGLRNGQPQRAWFDDVELREVLPASGGTPPAVDTQGVLLSAYDGCIGPCLSQPPLAWKSRQHMMYKPRQFGAGAVLDLTSPARKRVLDPGPYAGSDFLVTNEEADWGTLFTLTRPARVGVGLYGPLPGELQAAGWVRGADIVTTPSYKDDGSQTVPTYWKTFPAGTHALPPFGNVTPVILLREADDTPSKPPAHPAGLEQPIPNQECPAWVHETYRVKGVDGVWRDGWHGPIDTRYWCYFGHEHGSKPPAVMDPLISQGLTAFSYGYVAEKANKTAFCTACHAPLTEYVEGNKNYSFSWEGNEWVVTFHAATGKTNIAVNEHQSWGLTVTDASGRLLALVQLMVDTGYAESAHDNIKIIHPKALPAQNPRERFGAHRGLPFADQQGYGPFAAVNFSTSITTGSRSYINVDWIYRCDPAPLVRNPFDPTDPGLYHSCATMSHTGGLNLDRWFNVPGGDEGRGFCVVYSPAIDATDGVSGDGWGYTDPFGLEPRSPDAPDAVRQFVAPDLPGGRLCQVTELRFVPDGFDMRYYGVTANQNNSAYPYYEKAIKLGAGVPLN